MTTNYPTSADDGTTLPDPTAVNKTNSPSHSSLHANTNGAVKALEVKLGTGASTPSNNTFLIGNGSGTSAFSSLTSAQLAARISDETGSGSAVFATTPTLVTPKVDTINENTPANGVTIDGLNLKDGALNTNNSVVTTNITDAAVTPAKLVTGSGTTWVWQTFTPSFTGFSGTPTTSPARYTQMGKTVVVQVGVTGTSNATTMTFTLPVAPSASNSGQFPVRVRDNGTTGTAAGLLATDNTTTCQIFKDLSTAAFTNSGTKSLFSATFMYEAS